MASTLMYSTHHYQKTVPFMPTLPNEILSEIVAVALLSSKLNEETDQLFIQPKSRILFSSLAGFGMSCARFRGILLREWFGTFKVSFIDDIHDLTWRVQSFNVARFVRQIYFGDSLKLRSDDLRPFATLQTVSYPVSLLSPIEDGFCGWPKQLDSIELLDVHHDAIVKTCALLAAFFPSVRRLRLNSGTNGAHGPIPGEFRSAAELSRAYSDALQPLQKLQHLSLDVHLTNTSVFAEEHDLAAIVALLALAGGGQTPPRVDCPPNRCAECWAVRKDPTLAREVQVTKALAKAFPKLQTVEWSIWFIEGKEGKRRCTIKRGLVEEDLSVETCMLPFKMYPGVA